MGLIISGITLLKRTANQYTVEGWALENSKNHNRPALYTVDNVTKRTLDGMVKYMTPEH